MDTNGNTNQVNKSDTKDNKESVEEAAERYRDNNYRIISTPYQLKNAIKQAFLAGAEHQKNQK